MPQYCSVPGCTNSGGHRYPSDSDLRLKWRVAVRRVDPKTKKLRQPGKTDVVCQAHFTADDFTVTLLGERRRLKLEAVPSIFTHSTRTSCRPKRKHQQRETEASDAIEDVQMEVVVDSSKSNVSTTNDPLCDSDLWGNPFLDEQVQCNLSGLDTGLAQTGSFVIIGYYFPVKSGLVTGISISGIGFGILIHPPLLQYLTETFGVHGAFLITGGITLHVCIAGMLMRPSDLERKRKQRVGKEQPTKRNMT